MDWKTEHTLSPQADHTQMAVRDWLETQSRVTGYWRDLLISGGGNEDLIAALDEHASFLAAAAHLGGAEIRRWQ
ncbi:hypothetical protein [Maricaulis parjimensis]|uniref:hypothetical protein n=1 Tax=Maricaulis parjimensis TaxID=144023 RepID=UPI00193A5E0F|nr:hypothetical protein [Maricaulis parjimensis]